MAPQGVVVAAGAPQVLDVTQASAKRGARLVIVAVHKKPVDISGMLRSELTILGSMGYPDELFEVTPLGRARVVTAGR